MILKRMGANLRAQNWTAIGLEIAIVIVGVFLGILAANWNQDRLERRETQKLLEQVDVTLTAMRTYMGSLPGYYATTSRYGDRAIGGWNGDPAVSDEEFVIAAYQASQIVSVGNNAVVFGAIFGAENLRDIEDPVIRQSLAGVMTFDYQLVDLRSVSTRYREEVRKAIPNEIQAAIRDRCGDQFISNTSVTLPEPCDLEFSPGVAAQAAKALRARPELVAELQWHRAAVANQLTQVGFLSALARQLTERVGPPE